MTEPVRSTAQPSESGWPRAQRDLDLAVGHGAGRHVDDDRRLFLPGKAIAIGLVPSIRSAPQSGTTTLVALVMAQPIRSRFRAWSG